MHLSSHNWMRAEPLEITLRRLKKYGYDKVIMLAGGIGIGKKKDSEKNTPEKGDLIVLLGGDNYRIGMGGGAVSSVDTGKFESSIELNAGGASDTYNITLGIGAFIDVTVNDTDTSTQNSLTVNDRDSVLRNNRVVLTENELQLEEGQAFDLYFLSMCSSELDDHATARDYFDRAEIFKNQFRSNLPFDQQAELDEFAKEAKSLLSQSDS